MATKKKKKKNLRKASIKYFSKQDKYYKEIYSGTFVAKYKDLINHLPKERYLSKIFFNPKFVLAWSYYLHSPYESCKDRLDVVYSNFSIDDLYIYFKLNHEINKDKEERQYLNSLFELISDLAIGYTNKKDEYYVIENPCLVYGPVTHQKKSILNIDRDFHYYRYSSYDLKIKYGFNNEDYWRNIKEIYQLDLGPIDISQGSY